MCCNISSRTLGEEVSWSGISTVFFGKTVDLWSDIFHGIVTKHFGEILKHSFTKVSIDSDISDAIHVLNAKEKLNPLKISWVLEELDLNDSFWKQSATGI